MVFTNLCLYLVTVYIITYGNISDSIIINTSSAATVIAAARLKLPLFILHMILPVKILVALIIKYLHQVDVVAIVVTSRLAVTSRIA